jgi:hypothetical protein
MTDRRVQLKPIYRTVYSEEYGRVVHVHRRGKPAWVLGAPGILKGRLGIRYNVVRARKRLYRAMERLPRDMTGVKDHSVIRTPHVRKAIAQRHAAEKVARSTRARQHAAQARARRGRQKRHARV